MTVKSIKAQGSKPPVRDRLRNNLPLLLLITAIIIGGGWMATDFLWSQSQAQPAFGSTYSLPVYPAQLTVRLVPLVPSAEVLAQLPTRDSEAASTSTELISAEGLAAARDSLELLCPFSYEIAEPRVIPDEFFSLDRQQFRTDLLLGWLAGSYDPTSFRTIGVLEHDVYAPGYNFLFGQARLGGPVCVASAARMGGEVRGSRLNAEERWHSILRHEFGHTLGLQHSEERGSVMVYGDSLKELDKQGVEFTRKDWKRIEALHPIQWPK